jgi:hypothetical protein
MVQPQALFTEQFALQVDGRLYGEWHRSEFEALRNGAHGFIRHCWMWSNGRGGYEYHPKRGVEVIKRTVAPSVEIAQ